MSVYQIQLRPPSPLTSALAGKIVIPEHASFDEARRAWNLAIDQRPVAVVCDFQSFMSPILGRYVAQYRRDVPSPPSRSGQQGLG